MVIQSTWRGQTLTLSAKTNCLTLSLQSGAASTVYSYDNTGRLWTAMHAGVSYRRGLDGKMVAKWQTGRDARERRWLSQLEAKTVLEEARSLAAQLQADLASGSLAFSGLLEGGALAVLARAAGFGESQYQADVAGYNAIYQPVGILPPDQYMAVVLQAAEGCSFNTCTFCNFYKDRRFRIKTPTEFRAHAKAVREFLAEGLSLRRTVFLGDANAIVIPMPRLLPLLEIVHEVFDVDRLGGLYAFLDGFSGEKKTPADFAALARLGLQRVYIGLESGHDPLLRFIKKPGHAEDAVQAVHTMKNSGLAVAVIVLLGAGGQQFAQAHTAATIDVLNRMQLDADDLIYFSELVETEGLEYTRDAFSAELSPLTLAQRLAQGEAIERALRFDDARGTPHISRYDIREFVY